MTMQFRFSAIGVDRSPHPGCRRAMLLATALIGASSLTTPGWAAPRMEATITRTTFGIPHIKAKDFAGLGFGAAYAEAEDNICLMAEAYVSSAGERSRYFGADQPTKIAVWPAKNIENDIFYRSIVDSRTLAVAFDKSSPDLKALVGGWIAGYNRFLVDHQGKWPRACAGQPWVRPITRDDVLRWINGFALFASSSGLGVRIAQTAPPSATSAAAPQPNGPAFAAQIGGEPVAMRLGSNGWAFGGDATTNGRGLVVGNPHFPWFGPYRFYEMHMTIPGKMDVAGATILGQPYIGIGFNKDIAWTHTVDTAVHMTLMKLTLDPADPTAYLVDGKREPMEKREIVIADKGGAPIRHVVYASRYGPIVSIPGTSYAWTRQTAYAVADANHGNVRGGEAWLGLARAQNIGDIRQTLIRTLGTPFVNTIAADRRGEAMFADITPAPNLPSDKFASCGTVGGREPTLYSRFYILDGARSSCIWSKAAGVAAPGLMPGAEMASQIRRDYVQNSNDSYRWTNLALPPVARNLMLGEDPGVIPSLRTRSGLQEISRVLHSGKFDIDLGAATMLGNKSFAAQLALPAMLTLCKRPTAPAEACAALAKWDGKVELDSQGAQLFSMFWLKQLNKTNLWKVPLDPADPVNTPSGLNSDGAAGDALLADLAATAQIFKAIGAPLDAPLGQVQFAEFGKERIPISGAIEGGVLNNIAALPTAGGFSVLFGSSYIQSVTFDDHGPIAKAVLTYSQSTDPESPHFSDQTHAFSKKELRRFPFSEAEIAADMIGQPKTVGN